MPHAEEPVKVEVVAGDRVYELDAWLSGHFEPIDGRHHWSGRLAPCAELTERLRAGRRDVTIRLPARGEVPARLAEVNPWGGLRIVGG
jgi:hypothetical protein